MRGGHREIDPALGGIEDLRRLVARARENGIEIALDLAFQCSPDHPYIRLHPDWFRRRPDGSIRHAENPPKRYEDIVPLHFECEDWRSLWSELKEIVEYWISEGIRVFRVDNPHTKPYAFWEWLIESVRREHPEVIFLAEAFTRPRVMERLAKIGFSQSYTYFTWRNSPADLRAYVQELASDPVREYLRPNFWVNTPDILSEFLQTGGRGAFISRLVLAGTLAPSYGIYGPAFELCESAPLAPGREDYLDAEKYEIRHWDIDRPDSLRDIITLLNRARRESPALQSRGVLRFLDCDNDHILAYSKATADRDSIVVVAVSCDLRRPQSGTLRIPLAELGCDPTRPYLMHDFLSGRNALWQGPRNRVDLDPDGIPAAVWALRRRIRREQDFDYYM
jgi:starch synthase (maltosyl-transferring)